MTTIVLVVIGVILAAAAALMTVYYGGDALSSANTRAEAAEITGHLSQLQSAVQLYETETGARAQPGSIAYLVPEFMASMPVGPFGPSWYYDARMSDSSQPKSTPDGLSLIVAGLPPSDHGKAVCTAIARASASLGPDGAPVAVSSAATLPSASIGCFYARNWGEIDGVFVTYARVRRN